MINRTSHKPDGVWGRETEKAYASMMGGGTRVLGASTTEEDNKKKSVSYQDYEGKIAPKTYTMLDTVAQDIALSELTPTEQKQALGVINALPQLYSGRQLNSAVQEMYNVIEKKGVNSFFSRNSPYNIKNTMVPSTDAEQAFNEWLESSSKVNGVLGSGWLPRLPENKTIQYGFIANASAIVVSGSITHGYNANQDGSDTPSYGTSVGGGGFGAYAGVYSMATNAPRSVLSDPETRILSIGVSGGVALVGGYNHLVIADKHGNVFHGNMVIGALGIQTNVPFMFGGEINVPDNQAENQYIREWGHYPNL